MPFPVATALVLWIACQSLLPDRHLAERLARSGHTADALVLFEQIVAENPADTDARMWIARLQLRIGRTEQAEAGFRFVLLEHPNDIDARIGLGSALTRRDAWEEALEVLRTVEAEAGENADLFGALARAYRRAGDDRRALEYYKRARALSPTDSDLIDGFEATALAYGHSIAFEGFGEGGATDARSGELTATVRVASGLHLEGTARARRLAESSDTLAGGGVIWRASRATNVAVRFAGGSGNTSLPTSDLTAAAVDYAGAFEIGGSIRGLSFVGVGVVALSPQFAWDTGGRWRFDARYSYSRSSFDSTGGTSGDHSVVLRETWRAWRRVSLNVAYAYGIESFENLTADRLQALGATTIAGGLRIRTPSLTSITGTWEHQQRSNDTAVDRVTVSIMRTFP